MTAVTVTSAPFVFAGIEGQAFEITAVQSRADEDADDLLTLTVVDGESRQCAVTISYHDEQVTAAWVFPPGMELTS